MAVLSGFLRILTVGAVCLLLAAQQASAQQSENGSGDVSPSAPLAEAVNDGMPWILNHFRPQDLPSPTNPTPEDYKPICNQILGALNSSPDGRLDLEHFPRRGTISADFSLPAWQKLNPARHMDIVMRMLAYRYKDSESTDPKEDGMAALLRSSTPDDYKKLIAENRIALQRASFDADGDGNKDDVYRLGEYFRNVTPDVISYTSAFHMQDGGASSWQYFAFLKKKDASSVPYGFDINGGELGTHHDKPMGVFLYLGNALFYYLYNPLSIRQVDHDTLLQPICSFNYKLETSPWH